MIESPTAESVGVAVKAEGGVSLQDKLDRAASLPALNAIEARMAQYPQAEIPLVHRFTPGLYTRQMTMRANCLATSKIHKSLHQFIISKGRASIWTEGEGVVHVEAPYHGITTPGTRRLIFAHTEVVWTTFHATTKTTPEEVEEDIIHPHVVPFPTVIEMEQFILNEEARI